MLRRALLVLLIILPVIALTFIVTPDLIESGAHLRFQLSIVVAMVLCQLGCVWFFLTGLRSFRPQFKRAYLMLSAGILLLGLAQLQFPVLILLHSFNSWWVSSGLIILPFACTGIMIYTAMRWFARILGLSFRAASYPLVTIATLAVVAITVVLPHIRITGTPGAELQFDIFVGLVAWNLVLSSASAIVALRLSGALGPLYKGAMQWLAGGFIAGSIASLHEWLYSMLTTTSQGLYTGYGLSLWPLLVMSLVLLLAGAAFKNISAQRLDPKAGYIDVIVAIAGLASSGRALEPILDRLRTLTAHLRPGQEPSAADRQALLAIYRDIEEYLVTKDPMRTFTVDELRARLPEGILAALAPARPDPAGASLK